MTVLFLQMLHSETTVDYTPSPEVFQQGLINVENQISNPFAGKKGKALRFKKER